MKVKIDGKMHEMPGEDDTGVLTLGEQSLLKREYGVVFGKDDLDLRDPDHIQALLFVVLRKALPKAPALALISQVNGVREIDFVNDDGSPLSDEEQEELDPTRPPSDGDSDSGIRLSEVGS